MHMYPGFPGSSMVKNRLQCGRPGFDPWVRKIPWRRKWQPTPVFLPGKSHGQKSLAGYGPWGHKESDMTSNKHFHFFFIFIHTHTHTHTHIHTQTHTHINIYIYVHIHPFHILFHYGLSQDTEYSSLFSFLSNTLPQTFLLAVLGQAFLHFLFHPSRLTLREVSTGGIVSKSSLPQNFTLNEHGEKIQSCGNVLLGHSWEFYAVLKTPTVKIR